MDVLLKYMFILLKVKEYCFGIGIETLVSYDTHPNSLQEEKHNLWSMCSRIEVRVSCDNLFFPLPGWQSLESENESCYYGYQAIKIYCVLQSQKH